MEKYAIKMPRLTNNDDFVTLECWCVDNGSYVEKGQLLAVLETAKETGDLAAETSGYISYDICEGTEVAVEEKIAEIWDRPVNETGSASRGDISGKKENDNHKISKKALKLIEKYHMDPAEFPDHKIIKEKDVLKRINKCQAQSRTNEILIVCGGNIARMCIDTLRLMGGYRLGGITDMYTEPGKKMMGVPYIGDIDVLQQKYREGYRTAVNAYGGMANSNTDRLFFARKELYEKIKAYQFILPNLIHPRACIESSATMGEGNLVFAGAYIGSEAYIGNDCIINTGAIVSHDCVIGDHCRISPGAVLAGNVRIGENSIIGMGVTVYMGARIGENVIIYNGKHVFSDVPDNTVVR